MQHNQATRQPRGFLVPSKIKALLGSLARWHVGAGLLHHCRVWQSTDTWAAGDCVTPRLSDPATVTASRGEKELTGEQRGARLLFHDAVPRHKLTQSQQQGTECPQQRRHCLLSRRAPGEGFILTLHPLEWYHFCLQRNTLPWCLGYKHISPRNKKPYTKEERKTKLDKLWKAWKIKDEW